MAQTPTDAPPSQPAGRRPSGAVVGPDGRWAWLVVAAALLAALVGVASYLSADEQEEAPDFALVSTGWEGGNETEPVAFTLSGYRGKVVVLDFMAVSCTACRIVTSEVLKPLHAEAGPDVVILSIDTWADPATGSAAGETREELVRLQKRENATWRHALDTDGVYRKYAAVQLPKLVVVDPHGEIAYVASGLPSLASVRGAVEDAASGNAHAAVPRLGLVGLAAAAGVAAIVAPCAVGLLPAYLGVLLSSKDRSPLGGGVQASLGMVAAYAGLAVLVLLAAAAGLAEPLRARLAYFELAMGLLLVALGVLLLLKVEWGAIARRLGQGRIDGRRGLVLFGAGYALASFACTGPILLPILLAGLGNGVAGVATVFVVYAACVTVFLVAAAALVAGGKRAVAQWVVRHAHRISQASALLIIGGGLYLPWFFARTL